MTVQVRHHHSFAIENLQTAKRQLLAWADTHPVCAYLDSNEYPSERYHSWECLVAAGLADSFEAPAGAAFGGFKNFYEKKRDWLFGFFGYDLKNEVERLTSAHPDSTGFPDLFFFQPEVVAGIRRHASGGRWALEIFSLSAAPHAVFQAIEKTPARPPASGEPVRLLPKMPRAAYLETVEAIRRHIVEGDLYEMNLCQEFFAGGATIDPCGVFQRLNARARAPFAAYLRCRDRYLLCASPERFLRKEGDKLISQPIKGTRPRHPDPAQDLRLHEDLRQSEKDRAENVMIVDLVRNDLARHCLPGSVQVEELFGVYRFETVHQMISTVTGRLRPGVPALDALRDAFPMGSMTGAPKVMALQLIEHYERSRRGLYSGAAGYCSPDGDFDFNVVIRSILYNAAAASVSCSVGGAIVYDSVPEQEYEECLVKARAMMQTLGGA